MFSQMGLNMMIHLTAGNKVKTEFYLIASKWRRQRSGLHYVELDKEDDEQKKDEEERGEGEEKDKGKEKGVGREGREARKGGG